MIFIHHKRRNGSCRVKLCGSRKKYSGGPAYLHELHGIKRKAVTDKGGNRCQGDGFGKQSLAPEKDISPDDRFNAVLIDRWVVFTHGIPVRAILVSLDDNVLIRKRDPVIRDDRGRQERVCGAAFGTPDPADPEGVDPVRAQDASFIVGMDGEAGGMAARAGKLLELEGVNERIVIIL